MTQSAHKTRIDIRLLEENKRVIEQAAGLLGQTISAFTLSAVLKEANQVIDQSATIRLSNRDRDAFLAALDNPPPPNAKLLKAAKAHAEKVQS